MAELGYETHIFVCTNVRPEGNRRGCCSARGSEGVRSRFKGLIAEHGLKGRVRANAAGCLDYCESGVTVVVYPEGRWYGGVKTEDVERIFAAHVLGGPQIDDPRLRIPSSGES
jgi:(2Fe-2S) ferredoxin